MDVSPIFVLRENDFFDHLALNRPNLGSPRQILPGQKIHSSLLLSNTDYVPQAYPPEGVSSFWKRLRKDEDFRHKWVEFDLYEYTEDVISHFIVDPDKASHTLHSIAASSKLV